MGGRDVGVVRSDVWSYIVAMEYEAILQDSSLVMFYEVQDEEHYFRISLNIYGKVWNSVWLSTALREKALFFACAF